MGAKARDRIRDLSPLQFIQFGSQDEKGLLRPNKPGSQWQAASAMIFAEELIIKLNYGQGNK